MAVRLLEFQIQRRSKDGNRHYNTLSMYYYEKLGDSRGKIRSCEYYKNRISNGLFYGLEKEFFIIPYVIPKSGFGLRNYKFLSYPMRVLYYAVGLYLLRLSEEFITQYIKRQSRIESRYGGGLYYLDDELVISRRNTYYMQYYKQFRNKIRKEAATHRERKVVVKLDIENYYDNISTNLLTSLLNGIIKDSIKTQICFDHSTIEQLQFFFDFLGAGEKGIPQFENDIISGFLGHLYLCFADLYIDADIRKNGAQVIESHRILRYMDDTYIVIVFRAESQEKDIQGFLSGLFWRISDLLYYKLGLRLNPKADLFWLRDPEQRDALIKLLRKVSPEYHVSEAGDETIDNKMNNIFAEVEKLQDIGIEIFFQKADILQEEILKEVYDKRVEQMLARDDYSSRVDYYFDGFNFDLVKRVPQELVVVILKGEKTRLAFREYLLNIPYVTISDANIIVKYLAQTGFEDHDIINLLRRNIHMNKIVDTLKCPVLDEISPGYYDVSVEGLCWLAGMPHVIDQIRLRRYYETVKSYSLALNHLVNELQAICRFWDVSYTGDSSSYNAEAIQKFLEACDVDHGTRITVRNLFDRRNINPISHPSFHGGLILGIGKQEYERFRDAVAATVKEVLSRYSGSK